MIRQYVFRFGDGLGWLQKDGSFGSIETAITICNARYQRLYNDGRERFWNIDPEYFGIYFVVDRNGEYVSWQTFDDVVDAREHCNRFHGIAGDDFDALRGSGSQVVNITDRLLYFEFPRN